MSGLSGLERRGLVHLYTGDGKGKTTAAAGLAARMLGTGGTVIFCQFLKGGESGELLCLKRLGARIFRAKRGTAFTFNMSEMELVQLKTDHEACFSRVSELISEGGVSLVVLDEVVDAVNHGLISETELLSLIHGRPEGTELVLTGRNPSAALEEAADYHTDFLCVRHPYEKGVAARKGIEY